MEQGLLRRRLEIGPLPRGALDECEDVEYQISRLGQKRLLRAPGLKLTQRWPIQNNVVLLAGGVFISKNQVR
jgi:hypothetical protein